ncbi:MAG: winged helix DNA-binding domain-containing protein [Actinomycetota bacterium]|nr:winged helix DNA-binding domain-containing protein [Actinomycetota bacterium]
MGATISFEQRRARLVERHFLDQRTNTIDGVAEALVGLHSSDPISVYLALWARLDEVTPEEITHELYEQRSLLRLHAMRRTLFVAPVDLAVTMSAACTEGYLAREHTKLATLIAGQGVCAAGDEAAFVQRTCAATLAALRARGSATTAELGVDVPDLAKKVSYAPGTRWGASMGIAARIMFLLAAEGRIARGKPLGSWVASQYRWTPIETVLGGDLPRRDPEAARVDLSRHWLAAYGPGTRVDLQWWSGWTKRHTTAALEDASATPVEVEAEDGSPAAAWVLPGDDIDPPESMHEPCVRLLPGLDPTIMGWKQRHWYVGDHGRELFDRNGNAGPTIWIDGRVVGAWVQAANGEILTHVLDEHDHGLATLRLVHEQAAALQVWLGDTRITHRFRSPLELDLARRHATDAR